MPLDESQLHRIYCSNCGKMMCQANGQVKIRCRKCGTDNHVFVGSDKLSKIIDFEVKVNKAK